MDSNTVYLMNTKDSKVVKTPEKIAEDTFSGWLDELEDKEQPEVCSLDDPDCEACGS